MMIDLFNRFDKTILYKDGNNLENKINFLRYKLDNCLQNERDNIIQDIKKYEYGLKGEQKVLYELMNSHIPMYILHDINLVYKDYEAQIDFMIFTKKNCYIIECKQLYGDVLIDYSGNFYRKIGSRLTPIYSPITQLERHINLIRHNLLDKQGFIGKRIVSKSFDNYYHGIVVFSNESSAISCRNAPKDVRDKIIRLDRIIDYIKDTEGNSNNVSNSENDIKEYADGVLSLCVDKKYEFNAVNKDNYIDLNSLREDLKKYRYNKAKVLNYKPYIIFNDATMDALVNMRPKNLKELGRVPGFADKKIEMYGNDIIKIINNR